MRDYYNHLLTRYYAELKLTNTLTDYTLAKMERVYKNAIGYMNKCAIEEVAAVESRTEGYLSSYVKETDIYANAVKEYLVLSNVTPIATAAYGQDCLVTLSLLNLGNVDVKDVVVTPVVSTNRKEWPFEIQQATDVQRIAMIPAAASVDDALSQRMDIGWTLKVRDDVLNGCYPLTFNATYYVDGDLQNTKFTTYVYTISEDPDDLLIDDGTDKKLSANPRIIVTGFKTEPEVVYAGSKFKLSITVQNTSQETTVNNVLFDLVANVAGNDANSAYAAFLPTSGSSSVYKSSIEPGETYNIEIEMEAKADLSQKPYVLAVKMKYDTQEQINLSDAADVSIPVKQESKLDSSKPEVLPDTIEVGSESNIMYNVYNTGKTTLYNVKVTFESDTVEGGVTYLGNIAPGNTAALDCNVTGIAADYGDGTVMSVITYEDEAGNESRVEKLVNLYVYEISYDDYDYQDDFDMPIENEPTQTVNVKMIVIIAVAAWALLVILIIVIKKIKKNKKKKEERDLLGDDID